MILTYRYRIKDATTGKHLAEKSRYVNTAWNRLVDEQKRIQTHYAEVGPNLRWPSHYDFNTHFRGRGKACELHSDTLSQLAKQFVQSRHQYRKCPKWRGRKSLGWVPFIPRAVQIKGDTICYMGQTYRLWLSRPMEGTVKTGSFNGDARGRWYVNLQCEVPEDRQCGTGEVALDLGCVDLATLSNGEKIENPKWFRQYENALALAQRAGNRKRAMAIHAKIKNSRRHRLHLESTALVRQYGRIVAGDASAARLAQTRMAKSVLDAAWSTFRHQLRYKAMRHGAVYQDADERGSTQTCSACGSRSGPRGLEGLRIRRWICVACGVEHDRDINSAINILVGAERRPLAEEILVL